MTLADRIRATIREVPDFPKKGILFFDVTTLFENAKALDESAAAIAERFRGAGADVVLGVESRGFVVAALVAQKLGLGMGMLRKPGKLPYKTLSETYALEYGTDTLEMHVDTVGEGRKALIVDDLLATGGTVEAAARLVQKAGGEVAGVGCIVELDFLDGRRKLAAFDLFTLVHYDSEET